MFSDPGIVPLPQSKLDFAELHTGLILVIIILFCNIIYFACFPVSNGIIYFVKTLLFDITKYVLVHMIFVAHNNTGVLLPHKICCTLKFFLDST